MKARIVIGANYGDEGKGTVVATYTKNSNNVLNVLTNGGAQRGHSVLTKDGNITSQHFGSGTYFGADNYYSRYFILNPMQFVNEYNSLIIKPNKIYVDSRCKWSTPYDMMANLISEQQIGRHASCCMGIWNTIKRTWELGWKPFGEFCEDIANNPTLALYHLISVKKYYERHLAIPDEWKSVWNGDNLMFHFMEDCKFMAEHAEIINNFDGFNYDELIFENGQGLLLCDTGKDTYDTTPSNTGIAYALELLKNLDNIEELNVHYVTRPYLTRHGDGEMLNQMGRKRIASSVMEDRTNHYNEGQGDFRYGLLDIPSLKERIGTDAINGFSNCDRKFLDTKIETHLDVTHCDEMDRVAEFKKEFDKVNTYDTPLV